MKLVAVKKGNYTAHCGETKMNFAAGGDASQYKNFVLVVFFIKYYQRQVCWCNLRSYY